MIVRRSRAFHVVYVHVCVNDAHARIAWAFFVGKRERGDDVRAFHVVRVDVGANGARASGNALTTFGRASEASGSTSRSHDDHRSDMISVEAWGHFRANTLPPCNV